ncbi:hypothetical protein B0H10DRAFT_1966064 [Mycena sp. CBHHK59/15]|nr:hypothetical protein B0H10DRAFT_1966064 [Mycena sp. CBHHK59/15]
MHEVRAAAAVPIHEHGCSRIIHLWSSVFIPGERLGTPGSSGDEDEAQEIPHRRNTPKSKARLKGKSKKQPKIPPKEWCKGKRRGEGYKWIPAPAACNVIWTTPGQAKQIRDTGDYNTSWMCTQSRRHREGWDNLINPVVKGLNMHPSACPEALQTPEKEINESFYGTQRASQVSETDNIRKSIQW